MGTCYFVDINNNDDLDKVIQKCNYNFRQFATFQIKSGSNGDSITIDTVEQIVDDAIAELPGDGLPIIDGTASAGVSVKLSRSDHIHPTDTSRAPVSHASSSTTYGTGNVSDFGHVRLSDSIDDATSGISHGTAATPKAINLAIQEAKDYSDEYKVDKDSTITNEEILFITDGVEIG